MNEIAVWFNFIILLGLMCLLIFMHELGHFIIAIIRKNYKGYGLLPTPHIKLKYPYPHRLDYLSGFISSFIFLPFWIIYMGFEKYYIGLLFMLSIAVLDFMVVIFYSNVKKVRKNV